MKLNISIVIIITLVIINISGAECNHKTSSDNYPGNLPDVSTDGRYENLEFRDVIKSFVANDGTEYIAFKAGGTNGEHCFDSKEYFIVPGKNKTLVSSVLTAFSIGKRFDIDYARSNYGSIHGMTIKAFIIRK